jgi:prevent-host-death family protein
MATITITKAKAQLNDLIERARRGEEVIIARGSKPLVRLVPVIQVRRRARKPGALKGRISYSEDAFDPLTDRELKDLGFG